MKEKYTVPHSLLYKIFNGAGIFVLLMSWAWLAVRWSHIPDRIPTHFTAAGVINGWGGRGAVFIGPAVSASIFLITAIVERFPGSWNTGVAVTAENRDRVYGALAELLAEMRLAMALAFGVMAVYMSLSLPLPLWFTAVFPAAALVPLAVFFVRARAKK